MNRIKARLADTSESWIASIVLVLNLIKLMGRAPLSLIVRLIQEDMEKIRTFFNLNYSH